MATQAMTPADHNVPALTPEGERFALRQRQARMFAMSPLVPDHLRKGTPEQALANCYIALTLAEAMGEVPLVVMQNIHVVHGTAGFKSEYKIARANTSGIFHGRIDWRIDKSDPQNLSVTAFATLKDTGQEVSVTCDMAMAKAEGWTKNAKYQTMPEVMLRYRSASFLIRFYAGDVMLGYQTVEEIEDVRIASGPDLNATPLTGAMLIEQAVPAEEAIVDEGAGEVIDAEVVDQDPNADRGEAFNDTPEEAARAEQVIEEIEEPGWKQFADKVRKLIADAKDQKTWNKADAEFQKINAGLPDEVSAELDELLIAKKRELGGEG